MSTTNPSMPDKTMKKMQGNMSGASGDGYSATNPSQPDKALPKMGVNMKSNGDQYNTTNPKTGD